MNTQSKSDDNHYDVILIGSGIGGLTTASILAQVAGKRVLVLESHFKLGGFLHSFRRKNYVWDPGVHYIGEMQEGSLTRRCMDLVTRGKVDWHAMNSDFERISFPNETFCIPSDPDEFQERLIQRFPGERDSIKKYFRDLQSATSWLQRWFFSKQFSAPWSGWISAGKRLALTNTRQYLDGRFDDPLLQAIVAGQWPDFGSPPDESAFGIHAAVASDFLHGGYYPIGGSQEIVESAASAIEDNGGSCLVSHPVKEILVRDNRAYGVRVERKGKSESYFAPKIISNAGARTTFSQLVPKEWAAKERVQLAKVVNGTSAVVLFLGIKDDPRDHGFDDCNYWMYKRTDHRYSQHEPGQLAPVEGAFLSFGSLRNPGQTPHTAQIVSFSQESEWAQFADTKWKKRGDEYEALKAAKTEQLLDFVESRAPGLRAIIDYAELSTPLSFRDFTGHHQGAIYGQACDPNRLSEHQWSIGTSVKNLFLTGTDVGVPGVNSGLMVGVMTAGKLMGWGGMPRIFSSLGKYKSAEVKRSPSNTELAE
ncbi:MAG: phytoene desaturase family protein [Rubripirellula sp.]